MGKHCITIIVALFIAMGSNIGQAPVSHSKTLTLMGCSFTIKAVADQDQQAWNAINAGIEEIQRIENLISSWDKDSQTSLINKNAGIEPVVVDKELVDFIDRSIKISKLTNGAFDISYASIDRIYQFDNNEHELPAIDVILQSKNKIGYEKIIIDRKNSVVFLSEKGMKIGFGAIGKGYAANRAKEVMQSMDGINGGIVNASGDLYIWGDSANDTNTWNIKILDPKDINKVLVEIPVSNTAVVTSGDYEKFFTSDGNRYSHIINPKTGLPAHGIKSATIICKDAEVADGLATSVMILGIEDGLYLVNQLAGVEALLVTDQDKMLYSNNILLQQKTD